jgi:hypothetical protein
MVCSFPAPASCHAMRRQSDHRQRRRRNNDLVPHPTPRSRAGHPGFGRRHALPPRRMECGIGFIRLPSGAGSSRPPDSPAAVISPTGASAMKCATSSTAARRKPSPGSMLPRPACCSTAGPRRTCSQDSLLGEAGSAGAKAVSVPSEMKKRCASLATVEIGNPGPARKPVCDFLAVPAVTRLRSHPHADGSLETAARGFRRLPVPANHRRRYALRTNRASCRCPPARRRCATAASPARSTPRPTTSPPAAPPCSPRAPRLPSRTC